MAELDIERNVPLAPLTTLELGGPAKYFARAGDETMLCEALRWAADSEISVAILGGGSNLIVPDAGYDGLVVHIAMQSLELDNDGRIHAGAGVPWERVVQSAVSHGWAGVECLTGIPGSTGATPIQNVGAYGQEVAEVIERVRVVCRDTLEPEELAPGDCGFGYRDSLFKREPDRYVVTAVDFALRLDAAPTTRYAELGANAPPDASLSEVRDTVLRLRRQKSMVIDEHDPNRRSAGSFFVNPIVDDDDAERIVAQAVSQGLVRTPDEVPRHSAGAGKTKLAGGWLIENAGIAKGTRRGAIGVSTKHALALVHHGGGTTADLLEFSDEIARRVRDRFGVCLEREPRLLA